MDYKEKYEQALERAKALYNLVFVNNDALEQIFPELKEDNDDKVKQKIIKLIKMSNEVGGFALHKWEADEMLAWVEKQGEKSVDKLKVNDELYEHIRETCACIDDALSSETLVDMTDYLEMAERSAQSAFDMIEKQGDQKPESDEE